MTKPFLRFFVIMTGAFLLSSCAPIREESGAETRDPSIPPQSRTESTEKTEPSEPSEPDGSRTEEPESLSPEESVFFGKRMDRRIAAVNERTLSDRGSMLFDLFSEESFTAETVISLIGAYSIPENGFYGESPINDGNRSEILKNRNLKSLEDRISGKSAASPVIYPRYGILIRNASVRSFPTAVRYTDSGKAGDFDLFQESVLCFASGVLILHESSDGAYDYCIGEYYHGWIRKDEVAETDRETFRNYLSPESFAVSLGTDPDVPWNRLGLLIPVESCTDSVITLAVPEREEDGGLRISEKTVSRDPEKYRLGFSLFSADAARTVALSLLDTPYGWGDEHGLYDCSGFTGAIYRVFGYFLPRNSSAAAHFGGTKLDLKGMEIEEKKAVLRLHPGAVLSWPGHALFFSGTTERDGKEVFEVIQEGTGWCDENGNWKPTGRVTVSDLLKMYRTNGKSFLESIETLITAD